MAAPERKWMRVEVSFRIFGEDLEPEAVTDALGITPDAAVKKGEERDLKVGSQVIHFRPSPHGGWIIKSKLPPDIAVEEHLRVMLALLKPQAAAIRDLVESGYSVDFFCSLLLKDYNDGVELPPETTRWYFSPRGKVGPGHLRRNVWSPDARLRHAPAPLVRLAEEGQNRQRVGNEQWRVSGNGQPTRSNGSQTRVVCGDTFWDLGPD